LHKAPERNCTMLNALALEILDKVENAVELALSSDTPG
jgi:hypothetical protein